MNPIRKSDYTMHKIKANKFKTIDELTDQLSKQLPCKFTQFGYIEPGHGLKGKTQWITDDDDLTNMHMKCGRRGIILWCLKQLDQPVESHKTSCSKKRTGSDPQQNAPNIKKAKQTPYKTALSEVEKTIEDLRKKHGSLYSVEQLNCWAHMYQTQKHGSLEEPPDLPYFKAVKSKPTGRASNSLPSSSGISPTKRVTLRTECMKQLELWHSLLEKGGITKEQYESLQHTILDDIKDNF